MWTSLTFLPLLLLLPVPSRGDGRNDGGPSQVHVAYGSTYESAVVSWIGGEDTLYLINDGRSVAAEIVSYATSSVPRNTTKGFVTYESPRIKHARLTDLKPSTLYEYSIGNDYAGHFTSAPLPGTPFTFSVVGDLGQTNDSIETVRHIAADSDSIMVLHAGDMSYADCDGARWDSYFEKIEFLANRMPWMVTAGNHEIEPNELTGGTIMDGYKYRFAMPEFAPTNDTTVYIQNASNDGFDCTPSAFTGNYDFGNSFYSFVAGAAHVIVLNSYTRTDNASNQYAWLKDELETRVDRQRTPWLIGMWHSPWYNSNKDHQNEFNTLSMRASLEALLTDFGVNMVFSGHVHAYERSNPIGVSGTTYVTIGDGGNREGHSSNFLEPRPTWNAFRNGTDYGHGRVVLLNATHARWEWHANPDDEWVVEDEAILLNAHALWKTTAV